jgi:hypothetical protein
MKFVLILLSCLVCSSAVLASEEFVLDSNTAFFEGEVYNYVIPAPRGFRMVVDTAMNDGYSLAFTPEDEPYDQASMMIAVSLLRTKGGSVEDVILADTSAARQHFGEDMVCWPVDSVRCFSGETLKGFFFDNKSQPQSLVMMSYFDGGSDVVVFELHVAENSLPRFQATEIYTRCISLFKALKKATIEGDALPSQ